MAINPSILFQNLNGPNAEYPYGSAKNSSGLGLKDGTELKAQLLNDFMGFFQRVLTEASVVPSGNPDTVLASQYYDALMGLVQDANISSLPLTVSVGAGGDYATINGALEYLNKFKAGYANSSNRATITLLAGFVMAEQIICDGVDLSWITITSTDPVVAATETAITRVIGADDSFFSLTPVVAAIKGGISPYMDIVFRYNTRSTVGRCGFVAAGVGSVINGADMGCQNARSYGCLAFGGGKIRAKSLSNYEAGVYGTYADGSGATISSGAIDNHGCLSAGCIAVNNGAISCAGAGTGSIINNAGCTYQGCVTDTGGVISSDYDIDNSGCGTRGAQASKCGKIIAKHTMNNTGAGDNGAYSDMGGVVSAPTMNNRKDVIDDAADTFVAIGGMITRSAGTGGLCQAAGVMTADGFINI